MKLYNKPFIEREGGRRMVKFNPCGDMFSYKAKGGRRVNPVEKYGGAWAARMFVGLSVKSTPTYSLAFLVKLVREFLRGQTFEAEKGIIRAMDEDSSFVMQRGVYTHTDDGSVIEEDSVQVIIFNAGPTKEQFFAMMQDLAETIARRMQQESVWVQLQFAGVVRQTWKVTA
jgi:hypothetical protein